MLQVGTNAPALELLDETGTPHTLLQYKGKKVILYFYPKDDTPGCTKEACMIADVYKDFAARGVVVLGVSKDSPQSHKRFKEKYHLPFTLLSDTSGDCIKAYGAWQEKRLFGKVFLGIARITYIIDELGLIVKAYPDVNPATHALELLNDLRNV